MRSIFRYPNKLSLLIAFLGAIAAIVLSISTAVHSGTQIQVGSITEEIQNAKAKLDQAIAEKKKSPSKATALNVEKTLSTYNTIAAARVEKIRERITTLETQIELFHIVDASSNLQQISISEKSLLTELQFLREVLSSLTPKGLSSYTAPNLEMESNNSPLQANQLQFVNSVTSISGAITPVIDVDYFKFTAPAGTKVWSYVDTGGTQKPDGNSRDSVLTLFASDGTTVIEEDDDDGAGNGGDGTIESDLASVIAGRLITVTATYFLRVKHLDSSKTISPYTLFVVLTPMAATLEIEANNTIGTANPIVAANSSFGVRSGSIGLPGDTDFYAVTATSGNVLFISADNDPERDNIGTDTVLDLISPNGLVLLSADESDETGLPPPPAEGFCFEITSPGTYFIRVKHFSPSGTGTYNLIVAISGQASNPVASVSAASFNSSELAPESIVAAFGSDLAFFIRVASTIPLPTQLGGTSVQVRDSAGIERLAPIFFVAPGQVNYQIPPGTARGEANITVVRGDGVSSLGKAQISLVAPGLFSANASGQGVAAADVLRVKADGSQSYEPVVQGGQAVPIDLGPSGEQIFLLLYGTGYRFHSGLSSIRVTIGGLNVPVLFAGATPGFIGLDQANVGAIPRSLAGRGVVDVVLTVEDKTANVVKVNIR